MLDRDKWNENTNEVYSGYDILLQNVKTGKYLMVSPDRFEKPTAPGVYGGLLLKDADYQKLNSKTNPTALVNADQQSCRMSSVIWMLIKLVIIQIHLLSYKRQFGDRTVECFCKRK